MPDKGERSRAAAYRPLPTHRYAGLSAEDRRTQRRSRMLESAIELFGTSGYANTSIAALCEHSGCTSITIYEEFGGREPLLISAYRHVADIVFKKTFDAGRWNGNGTSATRETLHAYVETLSSDPRFAKIMHVEILGVGAAADRAHREIRAKFLVGTLNSIRLISKARFEDEEMLGLAIALVGAAEYMMLDWITSEEKIAVSAIEETLVLLYIKMLDLDDE